MKAKLKNDPGKDRGWARLELMFDDADSTRPAEGENFTISVQKIPEQTFLQQVGGEDRWPRGGAESYLKPDHQSWDGRALILELGPDFTSAMAKVPCQVSLKGSSGATFSKIRVDTMAIDLPPADYKITIDPKKLAEEERKKLEAEEQRKREEERLRQEEEQKAAELAHRQAELEKAEADDPEEAKSSKKWLIVLIAVLLLALAGGLLWYFRPKVPEPYVEPTPVAEKTPSDESADPPAAETPAPNVSITTGSGDAKVEVQNLFRRGAPYSELEEALAKFDGQEGAEDAVFLLAMELANVKPQYRTRLGSFFDPSDPRPAGSITKNALTAFDEYETAKKAGDAEAAAAQARLLEWARNNAATDPSAADLLNR